MVPVQWILLALASLVLTLVCGSRRAPRPAVLLVIGLSPLLWIGPLLYLTAGLERLTPAHLQQAILWLILSLPPVGAWGLVARWARRVPEPPRLDVARVWWTPRASHRVTWVLLGGLVAGLGLILGLLWSVLPGLGLALGLAGAWRWAHRGAVGQLRIESRDLVVGRERIPMEDVESVGREVGFWGPVRRERLAIEHRHGCVRLLVTGSPEEDVDAILRVMCRQLAWASRHEVPRGEALPPPAALEVLRLLGGVDQLARG
ncbi:MAG TPA: hypothetical protein ENK18_14110 [Deltaproteobacteria bacterium]|nr:hypothetical protein [Deltaproteobacteria bacterium]